MAHILWTRSLQLQKIDSNPGLLPVKEGQAFKQTNRWLIVKEVNLLGIKENLDLNIIKFKDFCRLVDINKPYVYEFQAMKTQADYSCDLTIEKFKQLVPSNRFKRGLIDPLGSVIKAITGNLDHEDALRYDSVITKLKNNQLSVDSKITVVSKMLNSLANSTETLHENELILDERLKRIEKIVKYIATKENNSIYNTYILGMYNMFISNFRSIYLKLSEIETALAFSKVAVLHQSIINSSDLLVILKDIAKVDNLVYPVNVENLIKIERTIVIKTYMKGNQITYLMEVPLTDSFNYNYYKLYPLPVFDALRNRTSVIIPKYPYILVKNSQYLPVSQPCTEIAADEFLCMSSNMVSYPRNTCAEQLMKFQNNLTLCEPWLVNLEDVKIQPIGPVNWIIYTNHQIILTNKCQDDITKESLLGTYIIKISEDCETFIENYKLLHRLYFAKELGYRVTPVINLPRLNHLNLTDMEAVNIKGLALDDLKHLAYVLNQNLKFSGSEHSDPSDISVIRVKGVSLATLLLYVILPIVIIFSVLRKYKSNLVNRWRNHRTTAETTEADNSALREGGVMQPQDHRVIRVCT